MRSRFVLNHYTRDLFKKLSQIHQGYKSVEEYFKEIELAMMRANVQEPPEQTMARFLLGLNHPIKKIAEFQPYSNMVELVHNAIKAERQVQEDNKYAKTKAYFASKSSTSAPPTSSSRFQSSSKPPLKHENVKDRGKSSTSNYTPKTTGNPQVGYFKCGGRGHKSFSCTNEKVMVTHDNGEVEMMSEDEYEAYAMVALASQEEEQEHDEALLCAHDNNPTLVVTKVLTTQHQPNDDQRCNIFYTKAGINGKSIKVIIDGGSCHNLASAELVEKLKLPLRKHKNPYNVQ